MGAVGGLFMRAAALLRRARWRRRALAGHGSSRRPSPPGHRRRLPGGASRVRGREMPGGAPLRPRVRMGAASAGGRQG